MSNGSVYTMANRINLSSPCLQSGFQILIDFTADREKFDKDVEREVHRWEKRAAEKLQAKDRRDAVNAAFAAANEASAVARHAASVAARSAAAAAVLAATATATAAATAAAPPPDTLSKLAAGGLNELNELDVSCVPRYDCFSMFQSFADDDIQETTATVSLFDPVALTPIFTPVRSRRCTHTNCFDLDVHVQRFSGKSAEDWKCGICGAHAPLNALAIDSWMQRLISSAGNDCKFAEFNSTTGEFVRGVSERAAGKRKHVNEPVDVDSMLTGSASVPIEIDSD